MKKQFLYFLGILFTLSISFNTYSFIDVVIPCHSKDCETLELCIQGIKENVHDLRRVIVVSDVKLSNNAEWFCEDNYPFSLKDIKTRFCKIDKGYKKDIKKTSRAGWYFQQLLKLYAPFVIPGVSENVLVVDADTVFLKPVSFINENGTALYNVGDEYFEFYFEHARTLLPSLRKLFPQYSGITHHMLFQKNVLKDLFAEVEQLHQKPFWMAFCDCVKEKYLAYSGASEYEIYFNYIFLNRYNVQIRKLRMKNLGDLNKIPYFKKHNYDYVSCHTYMRE